MSCDLPLARIDDLVKSVAPIRRFAVRLSDASDPDARELLTRLRICISPCGVSSQELFGRACNGIVNVRDSNVMPLANEFVARVLKTGDNAGVIETGSPIRTSVLSWKSIEKGRK